MDIEFNRNEDWMKILLRDTAQKFYVIKQGGGKKAAAKQHEKKKLTARERVEYLCDKNKPIIEIGAFAGYDMYEEQGGCPSAGTVSVVAYIGGKQCVVVANDQTVKAGA